MDAKTLLTYVENKWLALISGSLLMFAAGTQYLWGTYQDQVKTVMGYTQTQINTIGTLGNIGVYLGLIPGLLNDIYGSRLASLYAAVLFFVGNFLLYAAVQHWFESRFWLLAIFAGIVGNGGSAAYAAAVSSVVTKFTPNHRGKIIGLLVALYGLTTALFSQVYKFYFSPDVANFLLFLAFSLFALAIPSTILLYPNRVESDNPNESNPPAKAETNTEKNDSKTVDSNEEVGKPDSEINTIEMDVIRVVSLDDIAEEQKVPRSEETARQPSILSPYNFFLEQRHPSNLEVNFYQIFKYFNFHCTIILLFSGCGCGLTVMNNLGSYVRALGGDVKTISTYMSIISICNAVGRLLAGLCSDIFKRYISKAMIMTFGVFNLGLVAFVLSITENTTWLYLLFAVVGLSYGAMFAMAPVIMHTLFGGIHFGQNWSICTLGGAAASLLFATLVAGKLYEYNIDKSQNPDNKECQGIQCYQMTFIILGVTSMLACVLAGIPLILRTRPDRARRREEKKDELDNHASSVVSDIEKRVEHIDINETSEKDLESVVNRKEAAMVEHTENPENNLSREGSCCEIAGREKKEFEMENQVLEIHDLTEVEEEAVEHNA